MTNLTAARVIGSALAAMKALIVTSRLTFVPQNYRLFLEGVLARAGEHVAGLVLVDNLTLKQLSVIPGLAALGAPRMAATLLRNAIEVPLRKTERLFEGRHLPVASFPSMNDSRAVEFARGLGVDLIVNARTRDIYKTSILQAPRLGCINVHHGLLPEERGVMCDLFALSENKPAGFSVHIMTEKLDDGPILLRREVSSPGEKDFMAYVEKSSLQEGELVGDIIMDIAREGHLPQGTPNRTDRKIYRKLKATRAEIQMFRQRGVLL